MSCTNKLRRQWVNVSLSMVHEMGLYGTMQTHGLILTTFNSRFIHKHAQYFFMGPCEHMDLLPGLGPYRFSLCIRLYYTWVLPITATLYASWARNATGENPRGIAQCDQVQRSGSRTLTLHRNNYTAILRVSAGPQVIRQPKRIAKGFSAALVACEKIYREKTI